MSGANARAEGTTPRPAWLERGRIPSLDGLRAAAILLVLFAHANVSGRYKELLGTLRWRAGFLGVQIFFVLSGFLITTLMLREARRTGRVGVGAFYLRRSLRILPAYLAFLAALLVLGACGGARLAGRDWLALATYTVNFVPDVAGQVHHVWSLCVEEHFYLLWPLLAAGLTLPRCRAAALAALPLALAVRWWLHLAPPTAGDPAHDWTFARLDDLAVGCLLAFLATDAAWRARLDRAVAGPGRAALVLAALLAAPSAFSLTVGSWLFPPALAALWVSAANFVQSLAIALLLWAVATRPGGPAGRLLNWPLVRGLGVLSYSVYLWHPLFFPREPGGPLTTFPLNLLGVFAAAGMSYFLVERPFLALKGRLEHKPRRAPKLAGAARSPGVVRRPARPAAQPAGAR
jgi:peptidoglycan/LPS O-acetylase OafA/YrhL